MEEEIFFSFPLPNILAIHSYQNEGWHWTGPRWNVWNGDGAPEEKEL